jgi:hypothetical protein
MSDDIFLAYERVVSLVGVSVWMKLSDATRTRMFNDELERMGAECVPPAASQPLDEHPRP